MIRDDVSNKLVHLIKGDTEEEAYNTLLEIIKTGKLLGGTGFIKGGYNCVCFSEAPISKLGQILALTNELKEDARIKYQPFGVMVDKKWLFEQGGRPVIYQADDEFENLPEDIRYRHVRYEPQNGIDWTWEREWRIKTDELILSPDNTTLIVPNRSYIKRIKKKHFNSLRKKVVKSGRKSIEKIIKQFRQYKWHFIVLEDLGVEL